MERFDHVTASGGRFSGKEHTLPRFLRDLRKYREYIFYATMSQMRAESANSVLDWLWWVIEPLCIMCVYTVMFGYIFQAREPYFPGFIYCGVTMWRFFNNTLRTSVTLLKKNKPLITKIYIPKQILLVIVMFENWIKAMISMILLFALMIWYRIPSSATMLLTIPSWILLFMITYAVSCYLMHLGVFVEDVSYLSNVLLTLMMYFTGIFWSVEKRLPAPLGQIASQANPVALCITIARNGLLYGMNSMNWPFYAWFIGALLLCYGGTWLIYANENTYVKVL